MFSESGCPSASFASLSGPHGIWGHSGRTQRYSGAANACVTTRIGDCLAQNPHLQFHSIDKLDADDYFWEQGGSVESAPMFLGFDTEFKNHG
jgi:hypothetical protein